MKTAVLTFTMAGESLARYHFSKSDFDIYGKSTQNMVKKQDFSAIWNDYDSIIFISATGIAIRYIAPYVVKKDRDPAVLVIDDGGRFVISLLSGHIGGANNLTYILANQLGATEVITTASDARGVEAIDLFAKKNQYFIEDLASLAPVTGAMVDGKEVGFFSEDEELIGYEHIKIVERIEDLQDFPFCIAVTNKRIEGNFHHISILRPRNLHLGVGSKKGTSFVNLLALLKETMEEHGYSIHSIADINSIDIKRDEESIISLSDYLNIPFHTYPAQELEVHEDKCNGSDFVKETVGVNSVSCTSAYMRGETLLFDKIRGKGFTLSLTKE